MQINITNPENTSTVNLNLEDSLNLIKTYAQEGKWVYLDGKFIEDCDILTIQDIKKCCYADITNAIIGA